MKNIINNNHIITKILDGRSLYYHPELFSLL